MYVSYQLLKRSFIVLQPIRYVDSIWGHAAQSFVLFGKCWIMPLRLFKFIYYLCQIAQSLISSFLHKYRWSLFRNWSLRYLWERQRPRNHKLSDNSKQLTLMRTVEEETLHRIHLSVWTSMIFHLILLVICRSHR